MTKLLIATGIFHPESGGPATYLYHLLPHLQARGFEPHVLTYGDPDTGGAYPYPVTRIPRDMLRGGRYWRAALGLQGWADVVYAHSALIPLPPSRKPRVLKVVGDQVWERAVNRKWVSQLTDVDSFQMHSPRHPFVFGVRRVRRRAVRAADKIIVPSEYLKRMVIRWGVPPQRVQVIYNALPPANDAPTLTRAQARAELGLEPERPTLLTVARLTPWKGVDDFIVAMRALPDLHLIVAGDGAFRVPLQAFAVSQGVAERVSFLGRIPRERVALYMRAADYVGLYSGYEGLPHVLLESLRAGTPVIASGKGGIPEVVRHDVNGLLVRWDDVPALEKALRTAFAPGKQAALAANAGVDADKFDYAHMVEQTARALTNAR